MLVLAFAACASAGVIPAPIVVRAPSHDSAIIQSHRLGGNFAYSTHEAHAYGVQTPIIGTRTVPIGVSYVPGTPIVKTSTQVVTHKVPQVGVAYTHGVSPAVIPYAAGLPYAPAVSYPYVLPQAVDTIAEAKPAVDTA